MAENYAVNYDDKRFTEVENQKNQAINETQNVYNEMINNSESYYQKQIDASKEWQDKQTEIQQANTDFTIEKIEQQKEQAEKDYIKEQKGAYVDYQKATNQYGVNEEKLVSQGLQNSGYAESTRTNMYNTYQNRYASARESFNRATLNYDNAIKEAQLANNSALAQIAYNALQQQLELSLQGFQYKNTLVLQRLDAINAEKDRYYQRYQDVLSQINTENALAEQIRQYNETLAFQKQQAARSYSSGGSFGDSIKLTEGDNEGLLVSEPTSSGSLSSAGEKLYQSLYAMSSKSSIGGNAQSIANSKKINTAHINSAYKSGKISELDKQILLNRLG